MFLLTSIGQSDYSMSTMRELLVLCQLCILPALMFHLSIPPQLKSYRGNSTLSNWPHIHFVFGFPNNHCIYL